MGVISISKIWDGDNAVAAVAELVVDAIQACLEEHSKAFSLSDAIQTL